MKRSIGKSDCPINLALEMFGDQWSLLIIRDIVFWGKHTFGEFLASDEGIATNILADRLAKLEANGILAKKADSNNGRKFVYSLTDKGMGLIPALLEVAAWSAQYNGPAYIPAEFMAEARKDREQLLLRIRTIVGSGKGVFSTYNEK